MTLWYALAPGPLTQPWGLIAAGVTVIVIVSLVLGFWLVATSIYYIVT